jgi:ParB family transcriptional regulator, chromosome partitioning protein
MSELKTIAIKDIHPDPNQPRKFYDEPAMQELIASVKEKGVLQPILIRPIGTSEAYIKKDPAAPMGIEIRRKAGYNGPEFLLVCGERRYRAASEAGLSEIPTVIRNLTDDEALELQIIENLQRKDVHPMEEAVAFKSLYENKSRKYTLEEIAARVGKQVYYVRQRLKLTNLLPEFQKVFYAGKVKSTTAVAISQLSEKDQQELLKNKVYKGWEKRSDFWLNISDWDLERIQKNLNGSPFDKKDPDLNPKMGPCTTCHFNSAVASLFPEDQKNPVCNNSECFKLKCSVAFKKKLDEVKDDPGVVLVDNHWYRDKNDPVVERLRKDGHQVYSYGNPSQFEHVSTSSKDFQEKRKTGKVLKAFVVSGDDLGKHIYIELKKGKTGGGSSKEAAEKVKSGTASSQDINDEIKRIRDREKRSSELDSEKIWSQVRQLLTDDSKAGKIFVTAPLDQEELEALANALDDKMGFQNSGWIEKFFGSGYEGITELGIQQLLRIFMMAVLPTAYGDHLEGTNHHAFRVIKKYLPQDVSAIELQQQEIAEKRKERVDKRIQQLQQTKKELKAPAASAHSEKKAAPKKDAKKLVKKKA